MFKRIKPRTKEDEVADQVQSLILSGEILPGAKLPPERELAKTLGVGRHTLRVALNRLAATGLVEIRKPQGSFVKSVVSDTFGEPLREMLERKVRNVESFLEVRKVLECWAAARAAEAAPDEVLAKMARALEQMRAAEGDSESVAKADVKFHLALCEGAGNLVLNHVMNTFVTLMHTTRGLRLLVTNPAVARSILEQHEEIYEAVRNQMPGLASEKVAAHLAYVQETIRRLVSADLSPTRPQG